MTALTPGQEALREAARLEAARVYGGVVREHRQPSSVMAARAEAEITAAWGQPAERAHESDAVDAAIAEGWPTSRIIDAYGWSYGEVRAARKRLMAGEVA